MAEPILTNVLVNGYTYRAEVRLYEPLKRLKALLIDFRHELLLSWDHDTKRYACSLGGLTFECDFKRERELVDSSATERIYRSTILNRG